MLNHGSFAVRQTVKMISGFAPVANDNDWSRHYIEKALLIAQRLGKLATIAAYWATVRLVPMSGLGLVSRASPVHAATRNCAGDEGGPFGFGDQVVDPKPPRAAVVKSHGR
jgi:hypothetical protein